jgi:hypothetical protein
MTEWTEEAERAIRLCETWAAGVSSDIGGQLFLFGSAIYKGGEQFDGMQSDLDIVFQFPRSGDVLSRFTCMQTLAARKQLLELLIVPALHRQVCDQPGVSVVPITLLELRANVHKSGAPRFFDKNFFYDLLGKSQSLGIPLAGTRVMRDEARQALEYVQKTRNEFLSICANGTGGLSDYRGTDPMPKALLRSAAQLVTDVADGEWYDTRSGLEFIYEILLARRSDAPELQELFNKISVRRGGRGRQSSLTSRDQLLLSELLFDKAAASETEEIVTWEIRIGGTTPTDDNVREIFSAITKIIPGATLIGFRSGSLVLTIRSSQTSFELFKSLHVLNVLDKLLRVESVLLDLAGDENSAVSRLDDSRESILMRYISSWQPGPRKNWLDAEAQFGKYLEQVMEQEARLRGGQVIRNVSFDGVEIPFEIDFLLTWDMEGGAKERIGIEVVWLRSPSTFFHKVSQVLPLGRPLILVAYGSSELLQGLRGDISRLTQLNANVRVVTIQEDQ